MPSSDSEIQAVEKILDQFYAALNAMLNGDPAPIEDVFSHRDDVNCLTATGFFLVGWKPFFDDWRSQAEKSQGGRIEMGEHHVIMGHDMAVANHVSNGEIRHQDGSMEQLSLRESSVFRKEDGQWKICSHHTDRLPGWEKVVGGGS